VLSPLEYVLAANVMRRHLRTQQKKEILAAALKQDPSLSNRRAAALTMLDDKTVAAVRAKLESRAEIPHVETRTDSKGRSQPATKPKPEEKTEEAEAEVQGEAEAGPALYAEPATSGEAEAPKEAAPQSGGQIRLLGVGLMYAEKAIDWLKQIPKSDPLRSRGLRLVAEWIERQERSA